MNGVAPHARPPVEWSETKNVPWKVEIPGKGSATPVVWGDRIYVLTAVPGEKRATAVAPPPSPRRRPQGAAAGRRSARPPSPPSSSRSSPCAAATASSLWERVVREELPHEGTHPTGTWASASAVTDGELRLAHFGSRGLYALDTDGKLLWEKDLGDMTVKLGFGEGSSPALGRDRVFVQWDHEGDSFIVALDRKTGRELWRQKRDEKTSWATPLVVEHAGRTQVVTSATNKVRSYDAAAGDLSGRRRA